ncbi:MAG: prephenate dehydrogenase/arogenate dehydrogenase family protein, partial [Clostridia bacterium]|nr:prephenate dehydrogenase/arogenate dehydrogenase family protein [Clostridia bacterium]
GSYKDLTRVAWLNPQMWTELFLENDDCLIRELDILIDNLTQYRTAIAEGDRDTLCRLLDDGRRRKEEVDG